ncbi:MAG: hypothetical protein A3C56_06415 [Ignavibacteria bacterium RIFCSPHIGHO2_02_FULL_56_12]|nr:MAG: hypothetical protein A3C56_06415 [Ignavibacteria bacterium RIFCSPHIGHO2_02_FULL_56_12]
MLLVNRSHFLATLSVNSYEWDSIRHIERQNTAEAGFLITAIFFHLDPLCVIRSSLGSQDYQLSRAEGPVCRRSRVARWRSLLPAWQTICLLKTRSGILWHN